MLANRFRKDQSKFAARRALELAWSADRLVPPEVILPLQGTHRVDPLAVAPDSRIEDLPTELRLSPPVIEPIDPVCVFVLSPEITVITRDDLGILPDAKDNLAIVSIHGFVNSVQNDFALLDAITSTRGIAFFLPG